MPVAQSTPLPACCGPWLSAWPWAEALPGARWLALRYDRAIFTAEESWSQAAIVPPDAVSRAAPKRQLEFLAGRLCAREALSALTGEPHVPAIGNGKAPHWPAGTVGSITHSGDLAAALVAREERWRGIGQDAEALLGEARAERLAPQILTPAERQWFAGLPAAHRSEFVTLAFSLKESLFKALFPLVGVRFYFQDAELTGWDAARHQATLRLRTTLSDEWPAGRALTGHYAPLEHYLLSMIAIPAHPA
ncbi:4'-phosphopantetheinyl transferase superfamily protein [Halomonas sp. HP20-15]|uniref:4'-phosphopantetheinyl transferase family protein n=1 Tax=Halomonas sp. HP20-15 TaxID=3085901 RepID=UPI002982B051|nr:4'-phosphopantetheinyl transferase superfamily protein [Halomonas sp. HP20-15]MDW5376390.1 4'-phosphopantetheinyl transferase superfamily protein [Halomonas sp. HP20-15]